MQPPPSPQSKKPMNSFAKVLLTVAGAILLGEAAKYAFDFHAHQCSSCGHGWRHFGAFNFGDQCSHTCPGCGQVQWWKCGTPHVLRGSQFVTPPPSSEPPLQPSPSPLPSPPLQPPARGPYAPDPEHVLASGVALGTDRAPSSTTMIVGREPWRAHVAQQGTYARQDFVRPGGLK